MSRTQINLNSEDANWWDFRNEAVRLIDEADPSDAQMDMFDVKIRLATATALAGILDVLGNILEAITVDGEDEDDSPNAGIGVLRLGDSDHGS